MAKDVIYIDVEDDITTIVSKVKQSKEKVVALVPPSRIGVLQSAVNMRLLQRAAQQSVKNIVLITNNQSLAALAGAAKIPVAKNLQSKPELINVPAMKVDGDDVIDGGTLPVGDMDESARSNRQEDKAVEAAINDGLTEVSTDKSKRSGKKANQKVPNFSSFRKKFFIISGASLVLIGFLVWAIWFAPKATVIITAKTTTVTVDRNISLISGGTTDATAGTLRAISQEATSEASVEFTATGQEDKGEKATGTVSFYSDSNTELKPGISIPAGTRLISSGGKTYTTDQAVLLTRDDAKKTVRVTAAERGESYNGATGSLSGAPSTVIAKFTDATSGGTTRMAKVVSSDDVAKAEELLDSKKDDSLKKKVTGLFASSDVIISDSYKETLSEATPSVQVGEEASGSVVLKLTATASMLAVSETDLAKLVEVGVNRELADKKSQKMYDDGLKEVKFSQFSSQGDTPTVRITSNAVVGPVVDEAQVKEASKGKRFGDIQSNIESIEGVKDVDIRFSPFWVRTVPNNVDRITVEFKLQNAK